MPTEPEQHEPIEVPALREDLRFLGRVANITGHDAWLIFDPLQHRYFRIDQLTFELLQLWNSCSDHDELAAILRDTSGHNLEDGFVADVVQFLQAENLLVEPPAGNWRSFEQRRLGKKKSWWGWLVQNYLFVRIPLVRPSSFLAATLPIVNPLLTRWALITTLILTLISLYLVSRQWDLFVNSFADFYSFEGALLYGTVLVCTKITHELGHAYAATRYGCRVPTMGVAFLVMFPVLYTDVSDAWRLRSRQQRLIIGSAGMMAEIMIAAVATLLWVFLPDGAAKSVAFVTATLSWTMSLAVNLNPFMRFDGYYLLSDMIGVENLQARSFAFGRWKMRELLFGLGQEPPEHMPVRLRTTLYLYAWGTWIYRLILFIAIALLVYVFFFKILGVLLFIVEIVWFIARPGWSEIKVWWTMKTRIFESYRSYALVLVAVGLIVLAVLPLSRSISFPAVAEAARYERIFAPDAARIETVVIRHNATVEKGDVLFTLVSPDLEQDIELTKLQIQLAGERLRRVASNREDQSNYRVYRRQLEALQQRLGGLTRERERLVVKAPFAGLIADLDRNIHTGRWVNREHRLATLRVPGGAVARGYAEEQQVARLTVGSTGKFVPQDFNRPRTGVTLSRISRSNIQAVELAYLSSENGFGVPVVKQADGSHAPVKPQYGLRLSFEGDLSDQVIRGRVHLDARPESLVAQLWRQVVQVLVRESGV